MDWNAIILVGWISLACVSIFGRDEKKDNIPEQEYKVQMVDEKQQK